MSAERRPRLPFELRFAYAFPLPPVVAGLLWSVILGGISVLIWQQYGGSGPGEPRLIQERSGGGHEIAPFGILMMVASLMWGLLPATGRATSASELWDLRDEAAPLEARKRWKRERELLPSEVESPRRLILATLLGIAIAAPLVYWIFGNSSEVWSYPAVWWTAALLGGLFVLLARGIAMTRDAKIKRAPIFAAAEPVDLLDLEPQLRAGRCALRTAIAWMVGASLSSLFFLLGGDQVTIAILIFITVIALVSVIPPILRIQRIISAAKQAEMRRLQSEIREARAEVLESTQDGPDAAPGRLADLLAYLHYVETLPELPFDKSKLAITSLYFAVPLISWLWISLVQSWLGMIG